MGKAVRQLLLTSKAGALGGRTMPDPRTALENAATSVGFEVLDCSRSEDAQQLSACACVSSRPETELGESPWCIGQLSSSVQHAIRASGVGAQPAQIAAFPATRVKHSINDESRWTRITNARMLDLRAHVKPAGLLPVRARATKDVREPVISLVARVLEQGAVELPQRDFP